MTRTIGIDTGGTFTDLVQVEDGRPRIAKVPSTPKNPGDAIANGLSSLRSEGEPARASDHIVHGTTVALNALLTGRVAKVGLVTGAGFADLLEIGRQARPDIYALEPEKTAPLVPRELCFEVKSRVWPRASDSAGTEGRALETVSRPSAGELARLARQIARSPAESVAVCLLHSWADPSAEQEVGAALADLGLPLTLSGEVLPEHREFERFSTAVVNAALVPLMEDYLGRLGERIAPARLSLLQSTGGTLAATDAAREPVRVLLSGPAGGVVGAARAAAEVGFERFATFDMGGTSTDVAFHHTGGAGAIGEREARRSSEPVLVAGHPIGVPTLDIHTIGCGGGSLVHVDAGGVLHVGPESAGASPGPVCYGASDRPTVTDAHVLLGHVAEGPFLAGELALDHDAVQRAFEKLGRALGVSAIEAAHGVLDVARAAMRRAIGVMTMQRGADPESLPLIAFGGAGGLQGAALAQLLRMPAALIPRFPGALSASGMTAAAPLRDHVRTSLTPLASWSRTDLKRLWKELGERGRVELLADGHAGNKVRSEYSLDLRYAGQSFEIRVPESRDPVEAFHVAHARLYGYRLDDREIELVRLHARAFVPEAALQPVRVRASRAPESVIHDHRLAHFEPGKKARRTPVIERSRLRPGQWMDGPALVEEYSGTTVVPPGQRLRVTAGEHLLIERSR